MRLNITTIFLLTGALVLVPSRLYAESPPPEAIPGATALRLAIKDMSQTFSGGYPKGNQFLKSIDDLENAAKTAKPDLPTGPK